MPSCLAAIKSQNDRKVAVFGPKGLCDEFWSLALHIRGGFADPQIFTDKQQMN